MKELAFPVMPVEDNPAVRGERLRTTRAIQIGRNTMLDKIVSKIAALGVPGLVLVVAMAASGWAGGAATVTALAVLGGPLGMLGGIALLCVLALISNALTKYGFERVFGATVKKLQKQGMTKQEILEKVDGYPISKDIKLKLRASLEDLS
ncbi:MAG: hypothetical protein ACP5HU_10220 [Phycisphaerae bacterium]